MSADKRFSIVTDFVAFQSQKFAVKAFIMVEFLASKSSSLNAFDFSKSINGFTDNLHTMIISKSIL